MKIILLLCIPFVLFSRDLNVIAIGVGEKNVTFDEKIFPDIQVVYTPNISVTTNMNETEYKGTPELVTNWLNHLNMPNTFLIVDKNGTVYDQGYGIEPGIAFENIKTANNKYLLSVIEKVENGKTIKVKDKEINIEKRNGFTARKLPNFAVQLPNGNNAMLNSLLKSDTPTIVLFFYLNPNTYIGEDKEGGDTARTKQYMAHLGESLGGVISLSPLIQVERKLFNRNFDSIY